MSNATFDAEKLPPSMPDKKMLINATAWIVESRKKIMIGAGTVIGSIERKYRKKTYLIRIY